MYLSVPLDLWSENNYLKCCVTDDPEILLYGLWCLAPLSTIFQLYDDSQFYLWRKPEYLEKTIDLSQVADKYMSLYLPKI